MIICFIGLYCLGGKTGGNTEDLMWYNLLWTTNECQEMDRRQDSVHYMSQHVSAHTEGKRIFIINKLVVRREQWILSLLKSLERISKWKSPILPNVWCQGVQYIFYWKQSHLCSQVVPDGSINKDWMKSESHVFNLPLSFLQISVCWFPMRNVLSSF